jgi:small subunit ribosomal protein S21
MSIEVRVHEDIEKALRILKKKMQKDGLLKELKRRRFHEKPGIRKRRKQAEASRRNRKSQRSYSFDFNKK